MSNSPMARQIMTWFAQNKAFVKLSNNASVLSRWSEKKPGFDNFGMPLPTRPFAKSKDIATVGAALHYVKQLDEPKKAMMYHYVATTGSKAFQQIAGSSKKGIEVENLIGDRRVLEIGCGEGAGAAYLAQLKPAAYTGIDLSALKVKFCRKTVDIPNATFITADCTKIGDVFPPESFDVVFGIQSTRFIYNEFPRFLEGAHRVLRPGGNLLLADYILDTRATSLIVLENQIRSAGFEVFTNDITRDVSFAASGQSGFQLSTPYFHFFCRKL